MSFFNTTSTIRHSSRLPDGTTREQAIAMLQDHEFFLACNLHMTKFEAIANPDIPLTVPDKIQPTGPSGAYRVTDLVHTLPAGLWDSNVVSTYEITDKADGIFVRIRSPMSIVMDTVWTIKEMDNTKEMDGTKGTLELVEDLEIHCSRLLLGTVRGLVEGGWEKIHGKMLVRLRSEIEQVHTS